MGKTGKYYLDGQDPENYNGSWMADDYEQAYATAKKGGKGKKPGSSTCHLCGQPGHWKRECPLRHSMGQSKGTTSSSASSATGPARPGQPALMALTEHAEPLRAVYEELPGAYHTNDESPLVLGRELPGEECEPPNMSVFMTNFDDGVEQQQNADEVPDHIIQLTGSIDLGQLEVMGELRVHGNTGHVTLRPAQSSSTSMARTATLLASTTATSSPSRQTGGAAAQSTMHVRNTIGERR
eukprot:4326704-Amphidinium_carterae.1